MWLFIDDIKILFGEKIQMIFFLFPGFVNVVCVCVKTFGGVYTWHSWWEEWC